MQAHAEEDRGEKAVYRFSPGFLGCRGNWCGAAAAAAVVEGVVQAAVPFLDGCAEVLDVRTF